MQKSGSSCKRDRLPFSDSFMNDEKRRISIYLRKLVYFEECQKPVTQKIQKDAKKSEQFREKGNTIYLKKCSHSSEDHLNIWKFYSASVAFAPPSSVELAKALSNRSQLSLHLEKYVECIEDVDRAMKCNGFSDLLRAKLIHHKAECLKQLADPSANDYLDNAIQLIKSMTLEESLKDNLVGKCDKLKNKWNKRSNKNNYKLDRLSGSPIRIKFQQEYPCASTAIAVKYNSKFGRHVVATREIKPDEILAVESAYSLILKPTEVHTHCAYCSKVAWASLPCENCAHTVYCSEGCKSEAWEKYHDIECQIIGSLIDEFDSNVTEFIFGTRLAIQAVKENDENISILTKNLKLIDENKDYRMRGFAEDEVFDSCSFRTVVSLVHNADKLPDMVLDNQFSKYSAKVVYLLAKSNKLFNKNPNFNISKISNNEDAQFMGALITRLILTIAENQFSLEEQRDVMPRRSWSTLDDHDIVNVGSVVVPLCSYFNHSCTSNIASVFTDEKTMIMYSITTIKKDEQLFTSYWGDTYNQPDIFKKLLMDQRHFVCCCKLCQGEWPPLSNAPDIDKLTQDIHLLPMVERVLEDLNQLTLDAVEVKKKVVKCLSKIVEKSALPSLEYYKLMEYLCHFYVVFYGKWFKIPGNCSL